MIVEPTYIEANRTNAGYVAGKSDVHPPVIIIRGEIFGGEKKAHQPAKGLKQRIPEYRFTFGIDTTSSTQIAQDGCGWYWTLRKGNEEDTDWKVEL